MAMVTHTGARDRKVLKHIDHAAMKSSMLVIFCYIIVFSWVVVPGGFYERAMLPSILAGAFIAVVSIMRIGLNLMFDSVYGGGPLRWRRLFDFLTYLHAGSWSFFIVSLFVYDGLTANTFLGWMSTGILCSITIINSAAYLSTVRIQVGLLLLPTIVALAISLKPTPVFFAVGFTVYYFLLMHYAAFLYAIFWDRTELRRALSKKSMELEQVVIVEDKSFIAKQEFLSTITHEIRTPMNNVLGMLSLLQDSDLNSAQREYHRVATHSGETLLELIDDILDFSSISAGEVVLQSVFFNVRHIIRNCVEMLGPLAHEKGLELSYVCDPHIPLRVKGDPQRLNQVLTNLMSNAVKYSDSGEVIVEVHMSFPAPGEGVLRIHVRDDGPGLSLHDQREIFEAFNRPEDAEPRAHGTGLGLAICRGLVTAMKGEIGVFSKEGQGSTFWFTSLLKISTQQVETLKTNLEMMNKHVLVVGGTKGINRFLQIEMEQWGIHLDRVPEGDEAVKILRTAAREGRSFDLLIYNVAFNDKQSLMQSALIAEDPHLCEIPQILLTSLIQRGTMQAVRHGRQCSQVQFLTKPVFKESLYRCLSSAWACELLPINDPLHAEPVLDAGGNCSILLVEDNNVNQMVARGMLKKLGCHRVSVVSNGQEALGMLADRDFDLVLMDCLMPVMDGYMATQEIRKRESPDGRHLPVIAMTANNGEGEESRCLAAGMDDFLSKPVSSEMLEDMLRRWLGEDIDRAAVINTHDKEFQQGQIYH